MNNNEFTRLALIFGFVIVIIALKSYRRIQQQKMWHETARLALEKGQPLPPNFGPWSGGWRNRFGPVSDLRRGLICLAVGLAIYFASSKHEHVWGFIPAFVGIAFLVSSLIGFMRSDRGSDGQDPTAPR